MSLALALFFSVFTHAAAPVQLLELHGSINPGSAAYIVENLKLAEQQGAQAVVLRLDTPGGLLSSTRDIIQSFSTSTIPVIVFVAPGGASATSAGALITISAHVAAMAPGTNIGASHPVGGQGEDVKGEMGRKVTNDTAALARSQAALRGRKPEIAETFVTKSASFSADEAQKAGVVDLVASDLEDLLRQLNGRKVQLRNPDRGVTLRTAGLGATGLVRREMNAKQAFLHAIADPSITTILLTAGGVAFYAEVSAGFSLVAPAVIGAFCFLLAFVSMQTLPVNTGGVLLFALGFVLLIAEVFVTSYGLLTVAAVVALFLGGLFLMDPASTSMQVPLPLLIALVGGVGIVAGSIGYLVWRDRHRHGTSLLTLNGAEATIFSVSGNGGRAYVNGELWQFESTETFAPGDKAQVTGMHGLKVTLTRRT